MTVLGCHLSKKGGFMHMAQEAQSINATTFQFFTRNPRGGHAKAEDPQDVNDFKTFLMQNAFGPIVGYAPYTVNPASASQKENDFTRVVFSEDLARMEAIPHQFYCAHPGSAGAAGEKQGIADVVDTLNEVLLPHQTTTFLLLTPSGSGTEVGGTFAEMAQILEGVKLADHVGVCFDTAMVWGAGYDVLHDLDGVLDEFDKAVGLDRIKAVHLADPKYALGIGDSHHANLGAGQLGQTGLQAVFEHPKLADKLFILEDPRNEVSVYGQEINLLLK